jgi:hypothetical protein
MIGSNMNHSSPRVVESLLKDQIFTRLKSNAHDSKMKNMRLSRGILNSLVISIMSFGISTEFDLVGSR